MYLLLKKALAKSAITASVSLLITLVSAVMYLYYNAETRAQSDIKHVEIRTEFKTADDKLEQRTVRELDRLNRNIETMIMKGKK